MDMPIHPPGLTHCADHAEVYLETDQTLQNDGLGSTTLIITTDDGEQQFTFASGTTQGNIIDALNTFTSQLGTSAIVSLLNQSRIVLATQDVGSSHFVSVQQLTDGDPIVFSAPTGGKGTYQQKDHGFDGLLGDLDCDLVIGADDLQTLLNNWGPSESDADLNDDDAVNAADLAILLGHWTPPSE